MQEHENKNVTTRMIRPNVLQSSISTSEWEKEVKKHLIKSKRPCMFFGTSNPWRIKFVWLDAERTSLGAIQKINVFFLDPRPSKLNNQYPFGEAGFDLFWSWIKKMLYHYVHVIWFWFASKDCPEFSFE